MTNNSGKVSAEQKKVCIVCGVSCSGDLSNFRDAKTHIDVKDRIREYALDKKDKSKKLMYYQAPVCLGHYEMTRDDFGWLTGTGYYSQ